MNTTTIQTYNTLARRLRPAVEQPKVLATYFGLQVKVIDTGNQLAVIEWRGHRVVVEQADLEVRGGPHV